MTVLLLSPFAVLTAYAFLHRAGPAAPAAPLRSVDILGGMLVAMWNYMGWDYGSTVAGEVDRPRRTYPMAMAGSVVLVAAYLHAANRARSGSPAWMPTAGPRADGRMWRARSFRAAPPAARWRRPSPSAACSARRARSTP